MGRKRVSIFPLFEEFRRVTASLSDEQVGKAIRHALSRYYDGEEDAETDGVISLAAAMMLEQAARYDSFREQRRENGLKPKSKRKQSEAKGSESRPNTANNTDGKQGAPPCPSPVPSPIHDICSKAVELLNTLSGSSFRPTTKATQRMICARVGEGYTPEDIEAVIRHQCDQWGHDEKMRKYLRPETLFGSKFESYLSEARRTDPHRQTGYTLAPLEDPWETAMKEGYHD